MGDPTVLGMIHSKLGDISTDVKEIKNDMKEGAVKMENHEQRLLNVEGKTKLNEKITIEHIKNKKKHYNPYYSETFRQRTWRRKGDIGVATGGSLTVLTVVLAIMKFVLEWI